MLAHWLAFRGLRTALVSATALVRYLPHRDTDAAVGRSAFAVQSNHDVLQHAIDSAHDGMALFDAHLQLVAWNRAYVEMFQIPAELVRVGVTLDELVCFAAEIGVYGPGDVDELISTRLEVLIRPTESLRIYHAPFERVYEMRSVRLRDGGLFFTYSDATAQVKSEEELEAENTTLEHRVRERTDELHCLNLDLTRAKAEAEDANISKTRFLAAASHDLLQPLNAARLYTTALCEQLRAAGTVDSNRLVGHVDASLEAVEEILGALLEITQLDAGATKTETTAFRLGGLLTQLAIEFEPLARKRGLKLKFVGSSALVLSDRKLLRRLLVNLISNAIKYTKEGGVLVGVRHGGRAIRVEVYDTGIGICRSKQKLIFREFTRLPEASEAATGAGLGLSIVERLSRVLAHEVTLTSEVGRGSVFRVIVPIAVSSSELVGVPAPRFLRQRPLSGLVVAAIDNEAAILVGMETLLMGWECDVVTGLDLAQIEAALADADVVPDVILADFHVGDVNGLGIISALRRRHGWRPAVLITADRAEAIRIAAQAADVRVINKPVKPAALRSLLSQWRLLKKASATDRPMEETHEGSLAEARETAGRHAPDSR